MPDPDILTTELPDDPPAQKGDIKRCAWRVAKTHARLGRLQCDGCDHSMRVVRACGCPLAVHAGEWAKRYRAFLKIMHKAFE